MVLLSTATAPAHPEGRVRTGRSGPLRERPRGRRGRRRRHAGDRRGRRRGSPHRRGEPLRGLRVGEVPAGRRQRRAAGPVPGAGEGEGRRPRRRPRRAPRTDGCHGV